MLLLGSSPNDVELSASQEAINKWRKLPKVSAQDCTFVPGVVAVES